MDSLTDLDRAHREFEQRLLLVSSSQWELPSPDGQWDVRSLVAHVIGGAVMGSALLAGASAAEATAAISDTRCGADPVAQFRETHAARAAAFAAPGALEATYHHPALDMTGDQLLGTQINELALHSWDLARAIGADETLSPDVVRASWDFLSPLESFIGTLGVFGDGPSGAVSADAPLQERLLDLSGRRP
jgi:uncharacterized protein (TIGR03086 family)